MSHWINNAYRDTQNYKKNIDKFSCKELKKMLESRELDLKIYKNVQDYDAVHGYSIYVRELKGLLRDKNCE